MAIVIVPPPHLTLARCHPRRSGSQPGDGRTHMDWKDSPEQAAFRQEVRTLIQTKLPERYRVSGGESEGGSWQVDRISQDPAAKQAAQEWAHALSERGWIAPHWPQEYGGAGLTPIEQFIFKQEMAQAQAPAVGGMGVSLLGPTLIVHG
ncbi:MAG: hypothetical protein EPO16_04340, partial [Dehalococcoidia bacterium]